MHCFACKKKKRLGFGSTGETSGMPMLCNAKFISFIAQVRANHITLSAVCIIFSVNVLISTTLK